MGSLVFLIETDSQAGIVPAHGGAVKNYNTGMCAPSSNRSAYDILFHIRYPIPHTISYSAYEKGQD
jgi:hypothetical protein